MINNKRSIFRIAFLALLSGIMILASEHVMNAQSLKVKLVSDDAKRKVDVMIDGKLFTSYQYPRNLEKPFLSPIYAPNGAVITRGFPFRGKKRRKG